MLTFTFHITEDEKKLLSLVAKQRHLSMTKLIILLVVEGAKENIAAVGNLDEMDEVLDLIERVENDAITRDKEWKKSVAERLTKARKRNKMTASERREAHRKSAREWQRKYRERKKNEIHAKELSE